MTPFQSFFFWVGVAASIPPIGLIILIAVDWVVGRRRERQVVARAEQITREVAR